MYRIHRRLKPSSKKQIFLEFSRGDIIPKVAVNDNVKVGDRLYEADDNKVVQTIVVSKLLGIAAERSSDYIGRIHGEYILPGDLIGEKITAGGLASKRVVSASEGMINLKRIKEGIVEIVGGVERTHVTSPVNGKVRRVVRDNGLELETSVSSIRPMATNNLRDFSGEIMVLDSGDGVYTPSQIPQEVRGRIVYAGRHIYNETLERLNELGAQCVIVNSVDYEVFRNFTGQIIVLEGFGQLKFRDFWTKFFALNDGKHAIIQSKQRSIEISSPEFVTVNKHLDNRYILESLEKGLVVQSLQPGIFMEEFTVENEDPDYVIVRDKSGARKLLDKSKLIINCVNE